MKSDAEELMPRLLPVEFEKSTEDLDLNGPPRNPQEYLRQVQLEASLCPEVVVAQIDPRKLKKKQTVNVSVAGCHAAPAGFSPSLGWQQHQVSNFSDVRQKLHWDPGGPEDPETAPGKGLLLSLTLSAAVSAYPGSLGLTAIMHCFLMSITKNRKHWSSQTLDDNVLMPKLTDEDGWKRFCLGDTVLLDASSGHTDTEPEPALDYSKIGFPPLLSIVSRLNQSTVLTVLEILIGWFEEHEFTPQLGCWLYSLLACLEKPLLPEAHSSIRQLARRCAQLRSTLESPENEKLPPLNLLICLVARYFEQNDLADQQE